MAMIVKFWGTRGSVPVPGASTQIYGGNTPCVEVRTDKAIFICDAGSGIRLLNKDLKKRAWGGPVHLFLSHLHAAHVQGLPFLDVPNLTIHCHGNDMPRLKKAFEGELLLKAAPPRATLAEFGDAALEIEGVTVRNFALNHRDGCRGFAFEANGRKLVYIPDNELPIQSGDTFPDPRHEALFMRQMPRKLLDAANAANLLIMDGQFTDEQYQSRQGSGHSSCFSVTDFALQSSAQQLALFHHDPASADAELEIRARCCAERATKFGASLTVFPAREGMALRL